jgi:hypothetical protein
LKHIAKLSKSPPQNEDSAGWQGIVYVGHMLSVHATMDEATDEDEEFEPIQAFASPGSH